MPNNEVMSTIMGNDFDTMKALANGSEIPDAQVGTSSDSLNRLKVFLVAQAKNELRRVVKLTEFLDTVETRFMETADMLMAEYPDNLTIVSETMKTLTQCINRSNDLITQVMGDNKLNSFIINVNGIELQNPEGLDLNSRNNVRASAQKLLAALESADAAALGGGTNE